MSRTRSINKPLTSYPLEARPWVGFAILEKLDDSVPTLPGPHAYNHCILNNAGVEYLKNILDKETWWKEVGKELNDKPANNLQIGQAPRLARRFAMKGDRFKSKLRLKNAFFDMGESYVEERISRFRLRNYWF